MSHKIFFLVLETKNIKPNKAKISISFAPIVNVEEAYYVIGGVDFRSNLNVIARLSLSNKWSKAGELNTRRYGHGAIFVDGFIMVIGGYGDYSTEKCEVKNNGITCETQNPVLNNYFLYPELFFVPASYCSL